MLTYRQALWIFVLLLMTIFASSFYAIVSGELRWFMVTAFAWWLVRRGTGRWQ